MELDKYERLSQERKDQQARGLLPPWFSTGGYQLFKDKYLYQASSYRDQIKRIAKTAAQYTDNPVRREVEFFNIIWNGWLSLSTPILSNMGTTRGLPVSCSGGTVPDSIDGFYTSRREAALLTKHGFGTSGYLGNIRARGTPISKGGLASGVLPVIKGFVQDMQDVSQGGVRRGSWAGYIEPTHGDFYELITYLKNSPDDLNLGWVITDEFVKGLQEHNADYLARYQAMLTTKMLTGKGYFCFIDKINRRNPEPYEKHNLKVSASNLCNEITLHSDKEHTFTCVLASLNLAKYNEWRGTNVVESAIHFLDCVAEDFIQKGKEIPGLEAAVASTKKGRALGLGVCGLHTYLQLHNIPFESLDAKFFNTSIFKTISREAAQATKFLASLYGEPEWCKGLGIRNTHLLAIAPTKTTALLMGGVSEGINPDPAMVYTQDSAGGEIFRINPVLLHIMKARNVYNKKTLQEIHHKMGSVQHVSWLTDTEKKVFKTAFEIDQKWILRLAGDRGVYLDQWQSLNLFFSADESEEHISEVHKEAFLDERIRGLYYIYSKAGIQASKDCEVCS